MTGRSPGGNAQLSIYRNMTMSVGEISFAEPVITLTNDFVYYNPSAAAGDLDSDGKIDIVMSLSSYGTFLKALKNTSTPGEISFSSWSMNDSIGGTGFPTIAQIDGNGGLEVVSVNPNAAIVEIQLNPSSGRPLSISGRVVGSDGRGIRGATISVTDAFGQRRSAVSSSLGYYEVSGVFEGLYSVGAYNKRFRFATQTLNIAMSVSGVDLIGLE